MNTTEAIAAIEKLIAKSETLDDTKNYRNEEMKSDEWKYIIEQSKQAICFIKASVGDFKIEQKYIDSKIAESAPAWEGVDPDAWLKEVRGQE